MFFCFFKQKTAYEMRISDWSSDVCSSDLLFRGSNAPQALALVEGWMPEQVRHDGLLQHRRSHLAEGVGTVADRVFGVGIHLAEGLVAAIGQEDGIVAEPLVAARRPDERAVDPAFEPFDMAVGPGERERADEMRVAAGVGAGVAQPEIGRAHV